MLNKDILKGNWKEAKGKIKQQWGQLTDDEITQMNGSTEELAGKIQKKYGYDKERTEQEISKFLKANKWDKRS